MRPGSNAEAARFAAVRVNQIKLGLFVAIGSRSLRSRA